MPKSRTIETADIKIVTTLKVKKYLENLAATGLWGKSVSESAERLVTRGIEELIKDGTLERN